jgi:hypothetical protein
MKSVIYSIVVRFCWWQLFCIQYLQGNTGLLFTNLPRDDVERLVSLSDSSYLHTIVINSCIYTCYRSNNVMNLLWSYIRCADYFENSKGLILQGQEVLLLKRYCFCFHVFVHSVEFQKTNEEHTSNQSRTLVTKHNVIFLMIWGI